MIINTLSIEDLAFPSLLYEFAITLNVFRIQSYVFVKFIAFSYILKGCIYWLNRNKAVYGDLLNTSIPNDAFDSVPITLSVILRLALNPVLDYLSEVLSSRWLLSFDSEFSCLVRSVTGDSDRNISDSSVSSDNFICFTIFLDSTGLSFLQWS